MHKNHIVKHIRYIYSTEKMLFSWNKNGKGVCFFVCFFCVNDHKQIKTMKTNITPCIRERCAYEKGEEKKTNQRIKCTLCRCLMLDGFVFSCTCACSFTARIHITICSLTETKMQLHSAHCAISNNKKHNE